MRKWFLYVLVVFSLFLSMSCQRAKSPEGQEQESPGVKEGELCSEEQEFHSALKSVPPEPGDKPSYKDWLVRRLAAEPGTLNPIIATDVYEKYVNYQLVIETMLETDLDSGDFRPRLAESYEISEDKLWFTFHLRKDVKWHDGKPFSADDVIYSLNKILDPKVDAASLRLYYKDCEKIEKIDDYTIRFKWKVPYFKALEALGDMPIVPKHILDDGTDFNKHPYGRHPIGTGPYKFISWETGKRIELERNPDYWGKKPYFAKMIFKVITNDDVALQLFKQGGLDFVGLTAVQWMNQTNSPQFLKRANKVYYDYPQFGYIGWNMRKAPFDDKRVRKAMTMLLNREAILKNIFYCLGRIVSGDAYINSPYYDHSIKPLPYSPEKAKELLEEAGWIDRDGDGLRDKDNKPFRFELLIVADNPDAEKIATIFKEDLKKAGIEMEIRKLEWSVFLENIQEWNFDACMLGWALDANPDAYQLWHSSQADIKRSSNYVGFKNAEVDRLIEESRAEFDKNRRVELYHQIHRILAEEQPYTFLFNAKARMAVDKRIRNVIPHPIRPIFYFTDWYTPEGMEKYGKEPDSSYK